jgi:hypothetical protein
MYIVTTETPAGTSYLRSTIWTFAGRRERADEYPTREAAQGALDKAKKFMPVHVYKSAQIEEA